MASIFLLMGLCICASLTSSGRLTIIVHSDAELRDSITPQAPIYPGAVLVSQATGFDSPSMALLAYICEVDAPPEQVTAFYRERAERCSSEIVNNRALCHGRTTPFGVYSVFIDYKSSISTTFHMEVGWDRFPEGEWKETWIEY
jgi:hypothetical protein